MTERHVLGAEGPGAAGEAVIEIAGLRTQFGRTVIHDGLDLTVRRGEVLGVVGGSGTGKSVLLKEIIGLIHPAAGRISVFGQETGALDRQGWEALQSRWGVLFQDGALFSSMTVAENIQVPMREHTDLPEPLIDELSRAKIAMVGLPARAAKLYPSELSGGMRKRAGLARALALDPDLVFLDEPTAGLDPIGAAAFDQLIGNLQKSLKLTVFLVTHDLDTLGAVCDRIAALVDKKIVVDTMEGMLTLDHPWIREYFHGPRGRAARAAAERP